MSKEMLTVAAEESFADMPADDAQGAEETSAEELAEGMMDAQETGGNAGDDGQSADEGADPEPKDGRESRNSQIKAVLRSQREQIFREMGMSESEVRELVRTHKAEQMAKDDPENSVKAAREAAPENERLESYKKGISTLLEDGWTKEELQAFSQDETVHENLSRGMTLRQAARVYLTGNREKGRTESAKRRRAVPTTRQTAMGAAESGDMIASMTDAQFREFSKRAEAAMMAGRKVRFD